MRALLDLRPGTPLDPGEADGLVVDPDGLAAAIRLPAVREGRTTLHLRLRGPDGPGLEEALAACLPATPSGILLAGAAHGRDVAALGARLAVYEARAGLADRGTRVIALIDTPRGILDAASFVEASPRLSGLGWDGAALARALDAGLGLDDAGAWIPPLALARGALRLAAAAAGVAAVEAAYPGDDADGCRCAVAAARRDGFAAMLARAAWQVPILRGP